MRSASRLDIFEEPEDEGLQSEDDSDDELPAKAAKARLALPYDPLTDSINDDEWAEVKQLSDFLISFYEMTQRLEENQSRSTFGSLWQTITNLQHLNGLLRDMIKQMAGEHDEPYLKTAVRFGLEKLMTYWKKLIIEPEISYYAIATILHPKLRLAWFQDHWRHHGKWLKKAEGLMKTAFAIYVEVRNKDSDDERTPITRRKVSASSFHEDRFTQTMSIVLTLLTGDMGYQRAKTANELELYYAAMRDDLLNDGPLLDEPVKWWLYCGRKQIPTLFKLALDFLSIPCTTCECERVFGGGVKTVTTDRNKLQGLTIEVLQLQKN